MIADIILLILALTALIFATVVDIKIREVPNWLTYSLIISAIAIRLISSLATKEFYYITYAIAAFAITFIIANLLYRAQIWGGGDSKLLIGLITAFATPPYFLKLNYPFILILITSIFLCGAIYAITYTLCLAIKHKKEFIKEFKKLIRDKKSRIMRVIAIVLLILIAILLILTKNTQIKIILFSAFILIGLYNFIWLITKSVENVAMYKKIPISKLVEGDWITQNIIINKKIIYKKRATGINKQDIENIKKSNIKQVTVKQGIPFVPPFLLGFILTIIIGLL